MDAMISASKAALVAVQPRAFCIDDDVAPAHSVFGHVSDLILVGLDVQEESGSSLDAPNPAWAVSIEGGFARPCVVPVVPAPGLEDDLAQARGFTELD